MNKNIKLAISTCPNDTFMFHGLVSGETDSEISFDTMLTDIEDLNKMAINLENDVTKISFSALGNLLDDYVLLRSGAALGRGCGPVVVAKNMDAFKNIENCKIAVPGMNTTAALLIKLYKGVDLNLVPMPFYEIMPCVQKGEADLGVIIHEGRFTYQNYQLEQCLDLGKWWEDYSGLPIPLGGIAAKRSLGKELIEKIEKILSQSIESAFENPEKSREYIKKYAQEMDDSIIDEHIRLYVNNFSVNLGREGENAVKKLYKEAGEKGIIKISEKNIFI